MLSANSCHVASAPITLSAYLYNSLTYPGCFSSIVSAYIARPKVEGDTGSVFPPPDIAEFTLPYQKGKRVCAKGTGYSISYDTCRQAALAIYSQRGVVKHGSCHPHMMAVYNTILRDLSSACFQLCTIMFSRKRNDTTKR